MDAENFVEHIREGQALEEGVKKYMGGYRVKDVDQYVEKLHTRLKNMEAVYQERFEEMRMSLIAMTRERDEQIELVRAAKRKLNNIPELCERYIESRGLVTLPKEQYEVIKKLETNFKAELGDLSKKYTVIEQENVNLVNELKEFKKNQGEADNIEEELNMLRNRLGEYDAVKEELNQALLAIRDQYSQQFKQIESLESLNFERAEELKQVQARYKSLELQYQLAQNTVQQLEQDKDLLDKKLEKQQERWDTERTMLIDRYKGILADQLQCMQRLEENFNLTKQCMEKITEAEIKPKIDFPG
jgi:chromosome segregation ATPase